MLSDRRNHGLLYRRNAMQLDDKILCYLDNQKLKKQNVTNRQASASQTGLVIIY